MSGTRIPVVTCSANLETVRVMINDVLHLHVPRARFRGMQTWFSSREGSYAIEVSIEGTDPILAEYADRGLWQSVIAALDGAFF